MPPGPTLHDVKTEITVEGAGVIRERAGGQSKDLRPKTGLTLEEAVGHQPDLVSALKWNQASDAIDAKANALGVGFTGGPAGDMSWNGTGYERPYAGCVIYFSSDTGAHALTGEILAKYQASNGPASFGLPLTDETTAPDGVGRYNHFAEKASIYWTPSTGPMAVTGPVRDKWASEGWERGGRGYPVRDVFSPGAGETAGDFQNGVIWGGQAGFAEAVVASLGRDQLLAAVWSYFDKMVRESPDNIGLQPERSLDSVSDTGYGFWASRNRLVSIQIHGFHDNGLAPDTDFTAFLTLLFEARAGSDGGHDVTVGLASGRVTASGLGSQSVSDGVAKAVSSAFKAPIVLGTIPAAAPLLSLKVGTDGGLYAMLSPTPAGGFTRGLIQQAMDEIGR